jgi:hypothetical protein
MSIQYNIPENLGLAGNALKLARYFSLSNVKIVNAKKNNPYEGAPDIQQKVAPDDPIGTSILGTPIYTDLTLKYIDPYTDFLGKTVTPVVTDINLTAVLITIDQPVRIIKTEIQGRDGTVKEYIGKDDAKITVNAMIFGSNGVYPRGEVNAVKAWLDAPVSKGITAWWLDNLGISQIVVESYSFPQVQGGYSYQMFSFSAISDNPVELKITQPNV